MPPSGLAASRRPAPRSGRASDDRVDLSYSQIRLLGTLEDIEPATAPAGAGAVAVRLGDQPGAAAT